MYNRGVDNQSMQVTFNVLVNVAQSMLQYPDAKARISNRKQVCL